MTHRPARHRYRAWSGLQGQASIRPDELLEQLGDRFLNEDAAQVMSDLLHRGLESEDGARLAGIDELRAEIRRQLQDIDPRSLQPSNAAGSEGLSDDASELLESMAANPSGAGRALAGASPGVRDELQELRLPGGPLQDGNSLAKLLDLAQLDHELRQARGVNDVREISPEQVAAALGEDLAARFAALTATLAGFEDQGYIDPNQAGLTPRALRSLGLNLLRDALTDIASRLAGDHEADRSGTGQERAGSTRSYQFGDPFDLDLSGTVLQAVRRSPGTPVRLQPGDMTIFEREETGRVAMLLAIDRSRSMGERGYLLAAKRLALALAALVDTRFPRDRLDLLTFSNEAQPVSVPELASLEWERYAVGTNVQDALVAGRRKLADAGGLQRTLVLITDGEPTAYRDRDGSVCYSEPPTPEALAMTYAAARRLRRDQILLIVVLLTRERQTVTFAEELVRESGGRLVMAEPDNLQAAVMLGYSSLRSG